MKKISIVLFSVFLALGASAQKVVVRPVVPSGPRIVYHSRPYWNPDLYGGVYFHGMAVLHITIVLPNLKGRFRISKMNTATGLGL